MSEVPRVLLTRLRRGERARQAQRSKGFDNLKDTSVDEERLGPFQRVALTLSVESHFAIWRVEALVLAPAFPIAKPLGDAAKACASPSHL
jgi:hypothetical protein